MIKTAKHKNIFPKIHLFISVQFSHSVMSDSLRLHESQHARPPCASPSPGVHSNLLQSIGWCHPVISSSVVPFSSCLQSFPASGSFPMRQFFTSMARASASASVLPMNIRVWFPCWLIDLIPLQSKGLSSVFSNTTVQKHQFFSAQFSLFGAQSSFSSYVTLCYFIYLLV